jgi:hypothetical protein
VRKTVVLVLMAVAITFAVAAFSEAGGRGGGGQGWKGGHRGFHGRGRVPVIVGFGPAFYWRAPYWWGYPPYAYPPTVIVEPPPVYIEAPTPGYWYYCQSAREYYPTVPTCEEGWVRVPPLTSPSP